MLPAELTSSDNGKPSREGLVQVSAAPDRLPAREQSSRKVSSQGAKYLI